MGPRAALCNLPSTSRLFAAHSIMRSNSLPAHVIDNEQMPKALGPYSQAVAASGELVFISGQPGIDRATGEAPAGFEPQARQAFENLFAIVAASGLAKTDIVKTTIFLTDVAQFGAMNELFAEYFPDRPPARSAPIVQLPKGLLISIEAIAARS